MNKRTQKIVGVVVIILCASVLTLGILVSSGVMDRITYKPLDYQAELAAAYEENIDELYIVMDIDASSQTIIKRLNDAKLINAEHSEFDRSSSRLGPHWVIQVARHFGMREYEVNTLYLFEDRIVFTRGFNAKSEYSGKLFRKVLEAVLETRDQDEIDRVIDSMPRADSMTRGEAL